MSATDKLGFRVAFKSENPFLALPKLSIMGKWSICIYIDNIRSEHIASQNNVLSKAATA